MSQRTPMTASDWAELAGFAGVNKQQSQNDQRSYTVTKKYWGEPIYPAENRYKVREEIHKIDLHPEDDFLTQLEEAEEALDEILAYEEDEKREYMEDDDGDIDLSNEAAQFEMEGDEGNSDLSGYSMDELMAMADAKLNDISPTKASARQIKKNSMGIPLLMDYHIEERDDDIAFKRPENITRSTYVPKLPRGLGFERKKIN